MTCRIATIDDLPRLTQLAQLEHVRSRFRDRDFDRGFAAHNFEQAIRGMLTKVYISDSQMGFIAGIVQPKLFSRYMSAYELAWYSEDGGGMCLLRAFSEWAKKMRAQDLVVSNYAGIKPTEQFTRVMQRSGFSTLGTSFTKPLN